MIFKALVKTVHLTNLIHLFSYLTLSFFFLLHSFLKHSTIFSFLSSLFCCFGTRQLNTRFNSSETFFCSCKEKEEGGFGVWDVKSQNKKIICTFSSLFISLGPVKQYYNFFRKKKKSILKLQLHPHILIQNENKLGRQVSFSENNINWSTMMTDVAG